MKNLLLICSLLVSITVFASSEESKAESKPKQENVNQSKPVGYVVGIVKRGDNWEQDSIKAFSLQEKHLNFLAELQKDKKLIASGPLTSSPDARGLYIFNVKSVREAEVLVSQDEAIKSGWIKMEFHKWDARDYKVLSEKEAEAKTGMFSGGLGMVLIIFSVVILVLMLRTFRGKASI